MSVRDSRVDDYISKSADFAKPVLTYLRNVVHQACPEVKETIKWSFPNFEYRGSILCNMASFKQHCSFGFWLGSQMSDLQHLMEPVGEKTSMGHLGQIRSMADLPPVEVLGQYIKEAMALTEAGVKVKKVKPATPKEVVVPEYFLEALKKNTTALQAFEKFSPSHKREYVEWITEAKTEATRNKRIASAIEWITDGKSRNWKYEKC